MMIPTNDGGPIASDDFRPRALLDGDRYQEMTYRESYYLCTQHDLKMFDFDGRIIAKTPRGAQQPLIVTEKSPQFVPMKARRPAAPVRMGKLIVDSFTTMLFGESRFPTISVNGDEKSEDFAQTVATVGSLPSLMIRARNIGGSMGTVGISWGIVEGVPRFNVHNPKNLHVHSWIDRSRLLPKHVTEVYLFHKVRWDGKGFNKVHYWFRRDWTPDGDFIFREVPFERDKDPFWQVDEEKSVRHNEGVVHFEWIQNLPSDEIDGLPDYDALYDQFDQLDILNSVVVRGSILNLDPTLKLKMDGEEINRMGLKKGSDNALIVGLEGDASYLELAGTSITSGTTLLESMRKQILETAQCIVPDPDKLAAQGTSSVAMKAMFSRMIAQADVLRGQYEPAIKRTLSRITNMVREKNANQPTMPVVDSAGYAVIDPLTQAPATEPVEYVLTLPPRVETQQVADPLTGAVSEVVVMIPRTPGIGGDLTLNWPPYFLPTYDDQAKVVTSLQMATGGKAFFSKETATEVAAQAFGVDPTEEKKRLEKSAAQDQAAQAGMFPPTDGAAPDDGGKPPGAPPEPAKGAPGPPFTPEG